LPNSENKQTTTEDAIKYLETRFEINPENLKGEIVKRSGDFWLTSTKKQPGLEYETEGIRVLRDTGKYLKPTTYGLQILGTDIASAKTKVSQKQLQTLLKGDMIQRKLETQKGYIAIQHQGKIIGCGLYKNQLVSSRIPKGGAKELDKML